ncbi:MAG: hypothetical protein EPN23_05590 [Verrucomicrobia bacterium]|nr:MAG: hypothetical protein EPN23_05590 [Verrucomicrobiota bacterium]
MEKRKSSGRPPKFEEARRPVTVTLPEGTLQQLAALHDDRARAIVKATALAIGFEQEEYPLVDVVEVRPGEALIIVGPSKRLLEIEWLRLVEIAPARHLLVIPTGTAIEQLEVAVGDLLERLAPEENYERELLGELHRLMRYRRQQQDVSKAEILLIRLGKK